MQAPSSQRAEPVSQADLPETLTDAAFWQQYLAEDERLSRRVAIKVLPAAVADNPEGLARLEQEARILAQVVQNPVQVRVVGA